MLGNFKSNSSEYLQEKTCHAFENEWRKFNFFSLGKNWSTRSYLSTFKNFNYDWRYFFFCLIFFLTFGRRFWLKFVPWLVWLWLEPLLSKELFSDIVGIALHQLYEQISTMENNPKWHMKVIQFFQHPFLNRQW
jgi:hypothetical protein